MSEGSTPNRHMSLNMLNVKYQNLYLVTFVTRPFILIIFFGNLNFLTYLAKVYLPFVKQSDIFASHALSHLSSLAS